MKRKRHRTAFQRANDSIQSEGVRQCTILYSATALALARHWSKGQTAINRLFQVSQDIWNECAATNQHSILEMCENETGIEVQNGDGKSWHDLPYLNATIDTGRMTNAQWVYMRQQQVKWVAPQVMACILLALHRKYGFGYDRCARIYSQVQDIRDAYHFDVQLLKAACLEETGINVINVFTKE